MSPRPIIYVIGSLDVGGAERHLTEIIPRLDRARWKPIVCCLTERGKLADGLEAAGFEVIACPAVRRSGGVSRIRSLARLAETVYWLSRVMRRFRPAIAHFFLPGAYILGAPASILARVPVRIMSRRSLNYYQRNMRFGPAIEARLHRYMTAILGNSNSVVRQLHDDENVRADRLGLIYNGIDFANYQKSSTVRQSMRTSLRIDQDALVFVIVANLIPYKGHQDLLVAFSMACARLPAGWRLLVVGRDDGIGGKLREQAANLKIADNVLFLGSRSDVPDLLCGADVSVLSSHEEGFSNAVLESMAAGLPVIATDVGGNPEANIDGETGFIVPPRDPKAMSEAILRLSADGALRARMGTKAADRAQENFSLDACVSRYEDLYRGLLEGKRPGEIPSIGLSK
ncbi:MULTISPECIES: glycosyltransferase [unclassified Bradyrhizobium]|uniref:glycosyltransferase n=1 Tax=unclassified Bradyrhizobium TaxID=2631580 RepID=UPI001FF76708|nr:MULTISPECIES: glycosyltransferase [unclassified Bradyrhizobium]MCK1422381.1 glycosyltransferase [Bradyrhizobium sp. CW12]MCK1649073.1 glycosyltransferase [Bradyrhizobium sp. 154]